MAETSRLQQAFTECGEQLDRIINAYERITPSNPNYPRTMRITNTSDGTYIEVTINEDLTYSSSYQGGFNIMPSGYLGENYIMVAPNNWTVPGAGCDYNKNTFEIDQSYWNPAGQVEWINS